MGLYRSLSVVSGKSSEDVLTCVKKYATLTNGGIVPVEIETWYYDFVIISGMSNSCISFPTSFAGETDLSLFIARELNTSVIVGNIWDGDYWTYILYNTNGEIVSGFNSNPRRSRVPENEISKWKGNADLIAQSFGISAEAVSNYFIFSDDINDHNQKAYKDDEFAYKDHEHRQLFDFIKKLGVPYPFDSTNSKIYLFWNDNFTKYEPEDYDDDPADEKGFKLPTSKKIIEKPWWKFW